MEQLSPIATRRLTRLIKFMESLPESAAKHFDMQSWFAHEGENDHPQLQTGKDVPEGALELCGTTACAMGWAATMPYFKRLGLRLVMDRCDASLYFKGAKDFMFNEAPKAFDMEPHQAIVFFGAHNKDKTPKAWAERARRLMRKQSD